MFDSILRAYRQSDDLTYRSHYSNYVSSTYHLCRMLYVLALDYSPERASYAQPYYHVRVLKVEIEVHTDPLDPEIVTD